MAYYLGREWDKAGLRSYLSDIAAVAGAVPGKYTDGKAEGVRNVNVRTGSGLEFNVVPRQGYGHFRVLL